MPEANEELQSRAVKYTRKLKRIAGLRVTVFIIVLFLFSKAGLHQDAQLFWDPPLWLWIPAEWALIIAVISMLTFPVEIALRRLQRKHGFAESSFASWLRDWMKARTVQFVVVLLVLEPVLLILASGMHFAGMWAGAAAALVYCGFVIALPVLILPWFFPVSMPANASLMARLQDLAQKTGVGPIEILELRVSPKWKKANAVVAGVGKTRRILITDVLLSTCTEEEIEALVAHEFGHHKHGDMAKRLAVFSTGFVISGIFLQWVGPMLLGGPDGDAFAFNCGGMLLYLLVPVSWVAVIMNQLARRQERAADRFAWEWGPSVEAFISALRKATDHNLISFEKKQQWKYAHPAVEERIRLAEEFLESQRSGSAVAAGH
jgi:STE24 endopeptidase